jgi:putative transposase
MKKSKFTEEQIAFALHQADTGTSVEEVCRKIGISQATFYAWKKKFGGMGVSELRQLRQIEEENRKRSINPALSAGGELRDACVHVGQRGHMRCRATQRYLADW